MTHNYGSDNQDNTAESPVTDAVISSVRQSDYFKELPERILAHLKELGDTRVAFGTSSVDRLQHSVQTATLAQQDGRDDEYVVCALLHDIGDNLGPYNHGEYAAALLWPYISEQNHWMVANHHVFQGYHYFHHLGLDRNLRDQLKDHPHYDYTYEFVEKYDEQANDPNMSTPPLENFLPVVQRVVWNPKRSVYIPGSTGKV